MIQLRKSLFIKNKTKTKPKIKQNRINKNVLLVFSKKWNWNACEAHDLSVQYADNLPNRNFTAKLTSLKKNHRHAHTHRCQVIVGKTMRS